MSIVQSGVRFCARLAAVAVLSSLGACASFYVDNQVKDLAPAERAAVASPKPAQLLFDFQTKGVSNTTARDSVKDIVVKAVNDSGAFSVVSPDPQPNGAVLQVTINNVPLTDDAFAKGFVTGFTFGLVGSTVGDGYICTVDYLGGSGGQKITKSTRDAIYTSLGATASTPPHADKAKGITEAVTLMAHKCVGNALDALVRDPGFGQ